MNPLHYAAACILPGGRVTNAAYIVLSGLVGGAHIALAGLIVRAELATPGPLHLLYLVLQWMHFCLMSRRLHDAGYGNWPAFLMFLAYVSLSFLVLCPGLVDDGEEATAAWVAQLTAVEPVVALAHKALWMFLIVAPSESGTNVFGSEFGEGPAFSTPALRDAAEKADAERRTRFDDMQHGINTYTKARPPERPWGERRRAGFGRR